IIGWLSALPGENTKAYCKLCRCPLQAHKKDIEKHGQCKKHLDAFKYSQHASRNITDFVTKTISDKRKIVELKIAAFIAEHCSVSSVDHLGSLIPTFDNKSQVLSEIKIHRTKGTALINNVISPCLLEDLINDLGNGHYSLIIDESTAVDTKKILCLIIRYFSETKKKIVTTFYRLIEIEGGDANTLISAFKNQILKDGLKMENLIGIGVDGANVMIGKHHSFSSILKETNSELVVVKCVCHSLHLAAEYSCKCLPRNLDFIVKECHNWFSCSSKRQIEYAKLYKVLEDKKPLKIDKLSGTRWLARCEAITKIIDQWDALKLHFNIVKDKERCYTADQLYNMFNTQSNFVYLTFLKHILKLLTEINKTFQAENANSLKLLDDLHSLLYYYMNILIPPSRLQLEKKNLASFNFKDYVMRIEAIDFGYSFEQAASGLPHHELKVIKERCRDFLICLCEQLQNRIPDNIKLLEKISLLSPQLATSQIKPKIIELVVAFKNICKNIDMTIDEWNILHTKQWSKLSTPEEFWVEVFQYQNSAGQQQFGNITKFALAMLCLPFSNAVVERAFSIMNVIKNKLRNRMAVKTANAIMRIRFNMPQGCKNFQPTINMLKKFNSENMYENTEIEQDEIFDIFSCT
ncbi:uncharacterized protein LOC143907119, partial [Temnothorax americanus]|uniref:uncharacterized protein LOC143907119 n=1 Tax=Temnothorax americanus TaxID=1964332 RepID=UPI004067DBDA